MTAAKVWNGSSWVLIGEPPLDVYVRPTDWTAMPSIVSGNQKVCALAAVWNNGTNFVAVNCAGAYTVDWGDGSAPENVATGVQANHNLSYAGVPTSVTSRGYKTALVTITPQSGQNLTAVNFAVLPSQAGLPTAVNFRTPWLEIVVAGSLIATLAVSATGGVQASLLERFEYVGPTAVTNFSYLLYGARRLQALAIDTTLTAAGTNFAGMFMSCSALQAVPSLDTHLGTDFTSMFNGCSSLRSVPLLNTSQGTNFTFMFASCFSLRDVPALDTSKGTNFVNMFNNCFRLRTVPVLDTHLGTDFTGMFSSCGSLQVAPFITTSNGLTFSNMFFNCASLRTVPLFDTSKGTSFGLMFSGCSALQTVPLLDTHLGLSFSSMFANCSSLRELPALNLNLATNVGTMLSNCYQLQRSQVVNTRITISYVGCSLSADALDEIYTNLASGVTGKTIDVTGNWGTTADTPSIATAKGWTVTGS
jgi:hypothetical protein